MNTNLDKSLALSTLSNDGIKAYTGKAADEMFKADARIRKISGPLDAMTATIHGAGSAVGTSMAKFALTLGMAAAKFDAGEIPNSVIRVDRNGKQTVRKMTFGDYIKESGLESIYGLKTLRQYAQVGAEVYLPLHRSGRFADFGRVYGPSILARGLTAFRGKDMDEIADTLMDVVTTAGRPATAAEIQALFRPRLEAKQETPEPAEQSVNTDTTAEPKEPTEKSVNTGAKVDTSEAEEEIARLKEEAEKAKADAAKAAYDAETANKGFVSATANLTLAIQFIGEMGLTEQFNDWLKLQGVNGIA